MTVVLIDKTPVVMINPTILSKAEKTIEIGEGCLSCPGKEIRIPRSEWAEVKYNSINGKENVRLFGGMNAIIVAHELDHVRLEGGVLITDYERLSNEKEV
jgi:peptide deformylase